MAFAIAGTAQKLVTPANSGAYSTSLTYSGNATGAITWQTTGMPDGLLLIDRGSGNLSIECDGTAIAAGSYPITIKGIDSASATATKTYTLYVADPPSIDVSGIPGGTANLPYAAKPVVTGGVPDATGTWSLNTGSGSLPGGFTLTSSSGGTITGTATAAVTKTGIVLKYVDAAGQIAISPPFSIVIAASGNQPLVLVWASLSQLTDAEGTPMSVRFYAGGGSGSYTYSLGTGALPQGLSVAPVSGLITGSPYPGTQGTHTFTIRVSDGVNTVETGTITLKITKMTVPAGPSLAINAGASYSYSFAAANGTAPIAYAVVGSAPPGLTLNASTGLLSGVPNTAGTFKFAVQATDTVSSTVHRTYTSTKMTLTVAGAPRKWMRRIKR